MSDDFAGNFAIGQELIDNNIINPSAVEVFDRGDILGHSVCARQDFKQGDVVCSYGGKSYRMNSALAVSSTSLYRLAFDDEWEVDGHPSYEETKNHVGSFINAADGPIKFPNVVANVRFRLRTINFNGIEKNVVLIAATRDIETGEELWLNYGYPYWDALHIGRVRVSKNSTKTPLIMSSMPVRKCGRKTVPKLSNPVARVPLSPLSVEK